MPLVGMIGFIKNGDLKIKIDNIKNLLKNHPDITTLNNLIPYPVTTNFNYSYYSIHNRENNLGNISIYHLFFDYT